MSINLNEQPLLFLDDAMIVLDEARKAVQRKLEGEPSCFTLEVLLEWVEACYEDHVRGFTIGELEDRLCEIHGVFDIF